MLGAALQGFSIFWCVFPPAFLAGVAALAVLKVRLGAKRFVLWVRTLCATQNQKDDRPDRNSGPHYGKASH